jgi:hypothetical protein
MTGFSRNLRRCVGSLTAVMTAAVALSGCVLGNDSEPPVLAVDLFWASTRSPKGTCNSADVGNMDFRLLNSKEEVVKEESDRSCANGFEFTDAELGDYTLEVTGYDEDHNQAWNGQCDLRLDRFDRIYRCEVDKTSP